MYSNKLIHHSGGGFFLKCFQDKNSRSVSGSHCFAMYQNHLKYCKINKILYRFFQNNEKLKV